jgi:hypothetical protein
VGEEMKSQDENSTVGKEQGTKLVIAPLKIAPHRRFTTSFGFALLGLDYCSYFRLNQALSELTSCKSSELIPSFAQFMATIQFGMKQGLWGQTRAQTLRMTLRIALLSYLVTGPIFHRIGYQGAHPPLNHKGISMDGVLMAVG